jgi:hypothetical protein
MRAEVLPDDSESRFLEVDELPLDQLAQRQSPPGDSDGEEVEGEEERYLESDEWMETQKEMFWNTVRPRKCSFKEINTGVFTLHLSFQGVETPRFVNDNMLLRSLFIMAISYLRSEFKFVVKDDDEIELEYRDRFLPRDGAIGGVPILADAVIVIIYPRNSYVSSREEGTVPSGKKSQPSNGERMAQSRPQVTPGSRSIGSRSTPVPRSPNQGASDDVGDEFKSTSSPNSLDPRSYDKIRQSFKCPRFSGQAKEWKQWDKGFWRYLSIWELDYVLDPNFFGVLPLSDDKRRDNKLVYYIIEDAVQGSTLASSYIKQVPLNNGFEAYYTLHDGYVFAGATTATLLLNELSNFRFLPNETPTELCLRLGDIFQELKTLPGDAAVTFIDTQQIGYLINALRHEKEWDYVCSTITSKQIKGGITFQEACDELRVRCEANRAHELMDRPVKGQKVKGLMSMADGSSDVDLVVEGVTGKLKSLISTMSKRKNKDVSDSSGKDGKQKMVKHECLAADCGELTIYPLCPLHYHSLISAKVPTLKLRNGYGDATFDAGSSLIVYPARTPSNRLPLPKTSKSSN